ncbi:MAG: helix-turn-helix transcriptional regulator [Steroidobacteraceae bacterium]
MDSLSSESHRAIQILRLPAVCRATGLGRSMVYQLEAMSQFPRRVKIGARAVGWIEAEVQLWLAERITRSRMQNSGR